MSEKIVLIDGHSILNRAFYGVPPLTNAEGLHTNAIYGFLNILFKILDEEKPKILISTCCHSVNLLVQKHYPGLIKYLAKVKSPMLAHCESIKEQIPDAKTVFIGPCVSKKDEANMYDGVDAVLTFEQLSDWLQQAGIELEKSVDSEQNSKARIFPTGGGILKSMQKNEDYSYLHVDGVKNCIEMLQDIENSNVENCFIEMSACYGSCINGPVMEKQHHGSPLTKYIAIENYSGKFDFESSTNINLYKTLPVLCPDISKPSEREIQNTMKQMGKDRPFSELNCGTCGYPTCREKAIAIIQGKANISMCLPFLKEKAENFSDNIINNTPNSIFVCRG